MLAEAKIADAFALEIPEDPELQSELEHQLGPFIGFQDLNSEARYCNALASLLTGDREFALDASANLRHLPQSSPKTRAYAFLAALTGQDPDDIQECTDNIAPEAETALALLPGNLLKSAMRGLTVHPSPQELDRLANLLLNVAPHFLDPLVRQEEWLAASHAVRQRFLDSHKSGDPIQQWGAFQKALELAARLNDLDIYAQAVDACLSLPEPLLIPFQGRLLQQQIANCEDLDMKEELVEKLISLNPAEAKPHLYQLLRVHLGNNRPLDAWRMLEALREIGDDSQEFFAFERRLDATCRPKKEINAASVGALPSPVSVGCFGGDENDKPRLQKLGDDLMRKHPGLAIAFDISGWNTKNLAALVANVAKYDIIVASNLIRTNVSRGIRARPGTRQNLRLLPKPWLGHRLRQHSPSRQPPLRQEEQPRRPIAA